MKIKLNKNHCNLIKQLILFFTCSFATRSLQGAIWGLRSYYHLSRVKSAPTKSKMIIWSLGRIAGFILGVLSYRFLQLQPYCSVLHLQIILTCINIALFFSFQYSNLLDNLVYYAFWATVTTDSNLVYNTLAIVFGALVYIVLEGSIIEHDLQDSIRDQHLYIVNICQSIAETKDYQLNLKQASDLEKNLLQVEGFITHKRDCMRETTYCNFIHLYDSMLGLAEFCTNLSIIQKANKEDTNNQLIEFYHTRKEIHYTIVMERYKRVEPALKNISA